MSYQTSSILSAIYPLAGILLQWLLYVRFSYNDSDGSYTTHSQLYKDAFPRIFISQTQDTLPTDDNMSKSIYFNLTTEYLAKTAIGEALKEE